MAKKALKYLTGEDVQIGDSIAGPVDQQMARGRVLRVNEEKGVIVFTRRAPYEGKHKPLSMLEHEVDPADFSLVYRHGGVAESPAAPKRAAREKARA